MNRLMMLIAVVAVVLCGSSAEARGRRGASAQSKSAQIARMGTVNHIGGGMGGGTFEGNGFGATRQQAIQNACGYGTRKPIQIGVTRGHGGYYATVFYR